MPKKFGFALYMLLATVGAALLLFTVLASGGMSGIWDSVAVTCVLVMLATALAVGLAVFVPRKNIYSIGFYVLHAGILLFLVGSALYKMWGYSVQVAPPNVASLTESVQTALRDSGAEVPSGYYNRIPGRDGTVIDLGFNFRVTSFETEYYDTEKTEVKHYSATLDFLQDGGETVRKLTVNHPVYCGKWKIYLMAVTADPVYGYEKVQLLFKYDPGEIFSTTGILLTCIGTCMMCLIRPRTRMCKGKRREDVQ